MSKKNTIIVINGRKYDAKTGAVLTHGHGAASSPTKKVSRPARKPASHAAAHKPAASKTLMRKAVRKPVAAKQRLKAHAPIAKARASAAKAVVVKPAATAIVDHRLRRAKSIPKSQLITHFTAYVSDNFGQSSRATSPVAPVIRARQTSVPTQKPQTTAELLEYALRRATSHEQPPVKLKRHSLFRRRKSSTATA